MRTKLLIKEGNCKILMLFFEHPESHQIHGSTIYIHVAYYGVYILLSRLLCLAFSANLGLLCMPHPGMGPLV